MATESGVLDHSAEQKVEEKLETNPPAEYKDESVSKQDEQNSVEELVEAAKDKQEAEKPTGLLSVEDKEKESSTDVEVTPETKEEEAKQETPVEEEKAVVETVKETGVEEQDAKKEEDPIKAVKQSNNLISKVKQSLVKAKKAILGKSPAPNSVSTETKA